VKNVEAVVQKLPAGAKIIPGHGPLAARQDLERFHQMLVETTGLVHRAVGGGKSLEQVKGAGVPEKYKEWGTGFISTDRWLESVFNSVKKN
jgi:hypothetical protein